MKRIFYVWSGSLRGVKVEASSVAKAVDLAVRDNLPCVLGVAIRVSLKARGAHPLDVYYEPPYEDAFPQLFNGELDVEVARVTEVT